MRNGDYPPTRFQAQADAVNLICGAKTQVSCECKTAKIMALISVKLVATVLNNCCHIFNLSEVLEFGIHGFKTLVHLVLFCDMNT